MRALSPEEAVLWAQVAATIRPLSGEKSAPASSAAATEFSLPRPAKPQPPSKRTPGAAKPIPVSEKTLDASWDKRLRSGAVAPERTIDLHGMNLDAAWTAIDRGIDQAVARGERLILLITGHQRAAEPPIERGRIRAAVDDWLAASRHSGEIAAVRGAHRRHGGGGSLYIVLRRKSHRR